MNATITLEEGQVAARYLQQYDDALPCDELDRILEWLEDKENEILERRANKARSKRLLYKRLGLSYEEGSS